MAKPGVPGGWTGLDERFEWLDIPDDDAPAARAAAPVEDAPWAERAAQLAPDAAPAGSLSGGPSLVALGLAPGERRIEVVPTGSHWAVESYGLYRLRLEGERLRLASGFERLICLDAIRVEPLEHQTQAALRVLRDMRGRALLADEVGLGKTIEAGIVLKELLMRGLARRVLVLVPASLAVQWQEELSAKFGEAFTIVQSPEDWQGDRLIASLDRAKQPRHAAHALAQAYDLLVVDEAHKLKRASTQAHQFVNQLRKRYVLLLTATPVQNDLAELYHLITILQPGQLGSSRAFRATYVDAGDPRTPRNTPALRELLAEVMVRNSRANSGLRLPPRRAGIYHLALGAPERSLYDGLTRYIREGLLAAGEQRHLRLVLAVLQRELTSSPQAVAQTLRKLARGADDDRARARLESFLAEAEAIGVTRKAVAVGELVASFAGDQVLIFTEFRETLAALARYLEGLGHQVVAFHGGLSPAEKEAAVARFKAGAAVMISTESGAEGRNLQFCRRLINYDLPWNPMRIEQRIGRLHRLGQTQPVTVVNLSTNDTIESALVDLLAHKIRLFELVVGELDLILGELDGRRGFEEWLHDAWAHAGSDAALAEAFDELGVAIDRSRERFAGVQRAGARLSDLVEGGAR